MKYKELKKLVAQQEYEIETLKHLVDAIVNDINRIDYNLNSLCDIVSVKQEVVKITKEQCDKMANELLNMSMSKKVALWKTITAKGCKHKVYGCGCNGKKKNGRFYFSVKANGKDHTSDGDSLEDAVLKGLTKGYDRLILSTKNKKLIEKVYDVYKEMQ